MDLPDTDLLDEFLTLTKEAFPKPAELKKTQKKEIELWHSWNNNGRKPTHLKPLFESFKPQIEKQARQFKNRVELPTSAIDAQFRKHFVIAMKTYDPNKGQLNTWVGWHLKKGSRYVKKYQNIGKIPESQIAGIRQYDEAKAELTNKFGYEPDTKSMADHLGWSPKRVAQLHKERKADVPSSHFEGKADPIVSLVPKELEALHLLQHDPRLNQEERTVFEYTFGMNGKPKLRPGEISKKLNVHPSRVSRIRGKIKNLVLETVQVLN